MIRCNNWVFFLLEKCRVGAYIHIYSSAAGHSTRHGILFATGDTCSYMCLPTAICTSAQNREIEFAADINDLFRAPYTYSNKAVIEKSRNLWRKKPLL